MRQLELEDMLEESETTLASVVKSAGISKRLVLVSVIKKDRVSSYFIMYNNNTIAGFATDIVTAVEKYNNIQ